MSDHSKGRFSDKTGINKLCRMKGINYFRRDGTLLDTVADLVAKYQSCLKTMWFQTHQGNRLSVFLMEMG